MKQDYYIIFGSSQRKSFSKAAFNLHITQPTLSKQIQDLEHYLNKKLFIRGKEITLTDDGLYLRDNALEIISLLEKTESIFPLTKKLPGMFFRFGRNVLYAAYRRKNQKSERKTTENSNSDFQL